MPVLFLYMIPLKDNLANKHFPLMTSGLILACAVIYILQVKLSLEGIDLSLIYGMRPAYLFQEPSFDHFLTPVTSIFLHGGIIHLLGNIWFLWLFGNNLEDELGHLKFLLFFLTGGLFASLVHAGMFRYSHTAVIGASGAISAIMGGYALLFPKARIKAIIPFLIFFKTVEVRAYMFLGIWFLYQIWGSHIPVFGPSGGIAWFVHIGGFIFGLISVKIWAKG